MQVKISAYYVYPTLIKVGVVRRQQINLKTKTIYKI